MGVSTVLIFLVLDDLEEELMDTPTAVAEEFLKGEKLGVNGSREDACKADDG